MQNTFFFRIVGLLLVYEMKVEVTVIVENWKFYSLFIIIMISSSDRVNVFIVVSTWCRMINLFSATH